MFARLISLGFLAAASAALAAKQDVLWSPTYTQADRYDTGLFAPFENLNALSETRFTHLQHPLFPNHNVRIKKSTDFCDGTVGAYTGYIDVAARHLFFYFFESRNDPDTDDVIFWTNGGPGCSSALGLFMELGPCRVTKANASTTFNPHAWNANANVFFVDQPVGVGFSYAEFGESVSNSIDAGQDIAAFVAIFFEHFTKFKGRGFHMSGESYAGRYIPVFATAVYEQNAKLVEAGLTPINLTSIMIGNGCTDSQAMFTSRFEMQCNPRPVPPVLDISTCVYMKQIVTRCEKRIQKTCYDTTDPIDCGATMQYCSNAIGGPFFAIGANPYDLSRECEGGLADTLCYPIIKEIRGYLDRDDVRQAIGVDAHIGNFSSCSEEVGLGFHENMDSIFPTQYYIGALLERGVKALLYVGETDWACNWVGINKMALELEWTGQEAFTSQSLREWKVGGNVAGSVRSAGPFTFATIDGAGHMVPYDRPEAALEMVNRWLAGKDL